ncbi:hypothetical protein RFI_32508, partial [Reticulomyxa filosa]
MYLFAKYALFKSIFSSYIIKKKQKKLKNEFKLIHKSCDQVFSFRNQVVFMFYYLFLFVLKQLKEEEIQAVIHNWIRILNIKLGWIKDFDKIVANYISASFMFDAFCSLSKLLNKFIGHTNSVWSIDYLTFDDCQFICSGSHDGTICVWDIETTKQVQLFNEHSGY